MGRECLATPKRESSRFRVQVQACKPAKLLRHDKDAYFSGFFFHIFSGTLFHVFSPTVFAFASAGSALQALGAAETAGDEAPKPA